ncbi:hypothetical protein RMI40_31295 [Pseudomonas protegens]|uniref:hypothetical protein n=1 Tax=Pseudomonas protegens TaxID=380021 RepID=UPI00287F3D51|nr:hypothetical protein [Pseudomonas protegens]MDS9879324.1 hypothetical protein [Pseudomonas protegens]
MKDKLIWLIAILLFISGAIWAKIITPSDFFRIANIHDLFDIIGATATAVAAGYAAYGIGQWRKQISAAADHELARKVVVAIEKYKSSVKEMWGAADFCFSQIEDDLLLGDPKIYAIIKNDLEKKADDLVVIRAELNILLFDCDAIWGNEFRFSLTPIFMIESQCYSCVTWFLRISSPNSNEISRGVGADRIRSCWNSIQVSEIKNHKGGRQYVESLFEENRKILSKKLLKS